MMPGTRLNETLRRRPGWRIPFTGVLAASLMVAACLVSCSRGISGKQVDAAGLKKPAAVRIARVELKQVRREVESVGSLFPYEEVTVSSEVEGKVEQVLADVGDRVSAGQPLVKVSPIELALTLDQQRASLQQVRARLGLADEKGDLQDVREAAEVKKAAADLDDAEQKYRRGKSLLDQGLLPRESFDETEARYKSARAAYDLAVQSVQHLRAQLQEYKVLLSLAEKKLNDSVIRAPFAGQIKERVVTQGQYLRVQTPVIIIVNVDPLRARLKVPEKMAGWIRVGQPVAIAVEAYPKERFSGKLWRINPSVDQQTRSFEAEALINNPSGLLKPGFFVKASIPSDKIEQGLFVPQSALQYSYGVYKVYVVEGTSLNEKEVKIGERPNEMVEIVDGLKEGDGVALPVNSAELRDGGAIEVVP
jgi:membrane fusion protein (multidrug efflux system)